MASSQPPPKAIELTAAMVTVDERSNERKRPWAASISSLPWAGSILVNALMSAPAENVKMFELAKTTARSFPSTDAHSSPSSPISSGDSALAGGRSSHRMPTSPRVSSATVSRASSGCG